MPPPLVVVVSMQAARSDDLETAALHDLVARMKRFRRRVALPFLLAATAMAWAGMAAHALGYWSVLGTTSTGLYIVSAFTFLIAGAICGGPIAVVGAGVYVVSRGVLRRAWREEHRRNGVSEEWLSRNLRRFG